MSDRNSLNPFDGRDLSNPFDDEPKPWTAAGIVTLIASWLITNLVLQPMGFAIAYLEWAYETALNGLQTSVTTALGGAGSSIFDGIYEAIIESPDDTGPSVFEAIENLAMAGGIASPIVVTVMFVIIGTVVGVVIVIAVRYTAGYVPGGSYLQ